MGYGNHHTALFVRIAASDDGSLAPAAFAAGPFPPAPRRGSAAGRSADNPARAPRGRGAGLAAAHGAARRLRHDEGAAPHPDPGALQPHDLFPRQGAERGTAAEFGRQFEAWLNKKYKTKALKIRIAFIPTPRDKLLSDLNAGLGDIVAANLTITPERQQIVDFSTPGLRGVKEVIVTGPGAPALASLDDLAGREIHVRQSSSYWTHLTALNAQRAATGLKEITLYSRR